MSKMKDKITSSATSYGMNKTQSKEWILLKALLIQGFSFLSFGFFMFSDRFTEAGIPPKLNTK